MGIPTFLDAGPVAATETPGGTIAPALPASTAVNDVGIMLVMSNQSNTFPTPSGWTPLGPAVQAAGMSAQWYGRRLDGGADDEPDAFTTASGTALSTSNGLFGRIWVFPGCRTTGDPWEDVTQNGTPTNTATPTTLDIDTAGADRLAVGLAAIDDNTAFSSGLPPAGWTQAGTHGVDGLGGDAGMVAIIKDVAVAGTVTGVVVGTLATTENWTTLALALIGAVSATDLVVAAAVQEQVADSPTLTQVHTLVVADAVQEQVADSPTLAQVHVLVVADAVQEQVVDTPTLAVVSTLAPADAVQQQVADSPTLTQVHTLVVAAAIQQQVADTVVLVLPELIVRAPGEVIVSAQERRVQVESQAGRVSI